MSPDDSSRIDPSLSRDLLVALNADLDLNRETVCRLGRDLEVWALGPLEGKGEGKQEGKGASANEVAGGPQQDSLAARASALRVSVRGLRQALSLLPTARRRARQESERCKRLGYTIVTRLEAGYPQALNDLDLPPPVLYIRGHLPAGPAVAIVGSRKADAYGLEVGRLFGRCLASRGLAVISGLALGVDGAAHRGALEAAGGVTLAVLGCGLDVDYPRGHSRLAREIASRGAVVSELPLGAPPLARNFPVRNRIIAALSLGVLVAQATLRSGSLVTARLALDLGREVWAVPGRIFDERALGTNLLIRDGAPPMLEPDNVVDALAVGVQRRLGPAPPRAPKASPARNLPTGLAARVLAGLMGGHPASPESIASRADLNVEEVLALLLELELEGFVRRFPGPTFARQD